VSPTRATSVLIAAGVPHRLHEYSPGKGAEETYGEAVAARLGVDPGRVLKTLIALIDGSPVVAIVPVNRLLAEKALARAGGGKRAEMAPAATAERLTGYVVGGISPFGQRRQLPCFLDDSAADFETVFVSGGRRGLQLEIHHLVLVELVGARLVPLT
jgi:Cys-tRNA(Pro)/Cys-tRNA(Cys) deacylase